MKKSLVLMCIGGLLALCTPLAASEALIDPPVIKHVIGKENPNPITKSENKAEKEDVANADKHVATDPHNAHTGGYVVISAGALLLILILLILLL